MPNPRPAGAYAVKVRRIQYFPDGAASLGVHT